MYSLPFLLLVIVAQKKLASTLTGNSGSQVIFGAQNQILLNSVQCNLRLGYAAGAMADLKQARDRAFGGAAPAVMQDGLN